MSDTSSVNVLNPIQTDFNTVRTQLQSILAQKDSWKDLLVSSTGETLLDMIAGVGAVNNYLIARAIQAAFLETAQSDTQVLTIANLLGAQIRRRRPASVTATLHLATAQALYFSIPPWSQFIVNGNLFFFNRNPVIFPSNVQDVSVNLTEGQIVPTFFTADGTRFQIYTVGSGFTCSDENLNVYVDNEMWRGVELGLWTSSGRIYYPKTNPVGQVEVLFGNGFYGDIPPNGSMIQIDQFIVQGASINTTNTGLSVSASAYPTVSGTTTSGIWNAGNTINTDVYRFLAPRLFAGGNRCVTRQDYDAMIRTYAGVVDCRVAGEADISPSDWRWMNNIEIILLTDPTFTQDDIDAFTAWLSQYSILGCRLQTKLASPVNILVACAINVSTTYDLATVQQMCVENITKLLQPRLGLVGTTIYLSDITAACLAVQGVLNVTISSPRLNVSVLYYEFVQAYDIQVGATYEGTGPAAVYPITA